jgi:Ser/Thr protein kinase RdoA (MazF antagonist)
MQAAAVLALAEFGVRPASLRRLPADTNSVFWVKAEDGRRLVVRVGTPGTLGHSIPQVRSETTWLAAIAGEAPEIRAPVPLATPAGERVVEVDVPGVPGNPPCAVFEWIPGITLSERMTGDNMEAYGELVARLHRHAARYRPPEGGPVARHDQVFPYEEPVVLFGGDHLHFPPERRALFVMAAARVEQAIGELAGGEEPMRVMHGDLHIWNVLVSRRGPAALDFEDHLWGWPIQDLGTALYYLEGCEDFDALVGAVRRGYERVAPWPEQRPGQLDDFMISRALVLANDVVLLQRQGSMDHGTAAEFFARAEARLRRLLPRGKGPDGGSEED